MTEEEKFWFDLQGYVVIENAIDKDTLARMNAWLDAKAESDPHWRGQQANAHIEYPITWGPDFRALMTHPRVLPIMKEAMGPTLRLDHDYAIFLQPGHSGLALHGPRRNQPFDPNHYYHYADGKIYCGLCVATFALTDVLPGSGGLAVLPGSHKNNFPLPDDIRLLERAHPRVEQIPTNAGDCVIFTERLWHGTLPWRGPGERRTLFFKYAPGSMGWENHTYEPYAPVPFYNEIAPTLTKEERLLLMPPCADDFRKKLL